MREIEEMLKIRKSTIDRHIQRLVLVKKLDIWIWLNELNSAVKEKREKLVNHKCVIFHHDNATPHTSLVTRQNYYGLVGK